MRRGLVVGNWKMHGDTAMVASLVAAVAAGVEANSVQVAVCPTHLHLSLALQHAAGTALTVGAQNCSEHGQGAYTGEVSAAMLAETGCHWVILGHSERRRYFAETDAMIAARALVARDAGLTPILCVGESLQQREQGQAQAVVTGQLAPLVAAGLCSTDVIAYEPLWAIGSGRTASPQQAQAMHGCMREYLRAQCGAVAAELRLLYGGSVRADNARELFAQEDIDGALVGGAALEAEEFITVIGALRALQAL